MSTAKKNIALQNYLLPGAKSLVDQCPPDDPDTDVNRGCLLYKEARYEEGLAKFNAAQQVVGYDPHLSYNVALCYYRWVLLKFIYSEKATKFCEIFTLLLTVCTVVKS